MASKIEKLAALKLLPRHPQCVACGYDAEEGQATGARCPKCGGSSWETVPAEDDEWMDGDNEG